MKIMEKAKRFFTLNAAKHDGFTLVELIVVIAILAILAGVAVPAYSGYVKKAERAGDLTLLAAVNDAFAAACMNEGKEVYLVNTAELYMQDNCVKGVKKVDGVTSTGHNDAFLMFFAGNETTEFKTITSLVFDSAKKVFVDPANVSEITVSYNGSNVTVSGAALEALKESTYGKNIGTDALLEQINTVAGIAATMADGNLSVLFNDEDFTKCAMKALGATTLEEYTAKQEAIIQEIMKTNGGDRDAAMAQVSANAAVLYASQNAANYSAEQVEALFTGATSSIIKSNLTTDGKTAEGMAQATIVYGMYTAYANSEEYGDDAKKAIANDPVQVLHALDSDPDFKEFVLNSKQGENDLAAFQSSLGVITDATEENYNAVEHLMVNGYNNTELKNLLAGLTG